MEHRLQLYTCFSALFAVLLVTSNLLFRKFVVIGYGGYNFEFSVGLLFYPLSFLVVDLITEFFGKELARSTLNCSIMCGVVVALIVWLANLIPASGWSPVGDDVFNLVFGSYVSAVLISFCANFCGQLVDIYYFSYLKKLTQGNWLWLRSFVSTVLGQLTDTVMVVLLLYVVGLIDFDVIGQIIYGSVFIKIIASFANIPLYYLAYYAVKRFY